MVFITLTLLYFTGLGLFILLPIIIYIGLVFYIKPIISIIAFVVYMWSMMLNIGFYSSAEHALFSGWIDALATLIIFVVVLMQKKQKM